MTPQDLITIVGSVVGVGLALSVLIMRTTARLDRRIDEAADPSFPKRSRSRPARLAGVHERLPQVEMAQLASRQSRLDGRMDASARAGDDTSSWPHPSTAVHHRPAPHGG